ncbi:hypothetical protein OIU91_28430 [Streptomyces sp. NBC_01456]|uniref:hypothetical protein n=1 Tax=unclassified Streptomyces TaxID=2593676 RepID=UPI002E2ED7C0|nr:MULTISPECIES: hypothetical protein [unclassified Streptomyces]
MDSSDVQIDLAAQGWLSAALDALTADHLWTRQLERQHLPVNEMKQVAKVGEHLRSQWDHLTEPGSLKVHSDWLHAHSILARDVAYRSTGFRNEKQQHDWAEGNHVLRGVETLHERRDSELATLQRKIDALNDGEWTPGDLPAPAICGMLAVAAGTAFGLRQPYFGGFLTKWFYDVDCPTIMMTI